MDAAKMTRENKVSDLKSSIRVHAVLLGERLESSQFQQHNLVSASPASFYYGAAGFVVLYRFGVAVFFGLTATEEKELINTFGPQSSSFNEEDNEILTLIPIQEGDDKSLLNGQIAVKDFSVARFLVVADGVSKSVALARDEKLVNKVFDAIEPFSQELANFGRPPWNRQRMLKLVGQILAVRHRVTGRVAVEDKPDILWDRTDLERLYTRIQDEYELEERSRALNAKLGVISETVGALTDLIDTERSRRLEWTIIVLIAAEIALTLAQMIAARM